MRRRHKMPTEKDFLVYQEAGKTYVTGGNNITDSVGLKMLKASGVAVVSKQNVRHIKQVIMRFNKMTESEGTVDLTGCGMGFYNIPVKDIIEV